MGTKAKKQVEDVDDYRSRRRSMKRQPTIKDLKRRVRQTRIELDYRAAQASDPRRRRKGTHAKLDAANAAHHWALRDLRERLDSSLSDQQIGP